MVERAGAAAAAAPVGVPHCEQNLASATSGAPQFAQAWLSADPHSEQNLAVSAFALPQFEQTMGP